MHFQRFYETSSVDNQTTPNARKKSACSNTHAYFFFDLASSIEGDLVEGITLDDLKWPADITNGFQRQYGNLRNMYVDYCCCIVFLSIAMFFALLELVIGIPIVGFTGPLIAVLAVVSSSEAFSSLPHC